MYAHQIKVICKKDEVKMKCLEVLLEMGTLSWRIVDSQIETQDMNVPSEEKFKFSSL